MKPRRASSVPFEYEDNGWHPITQHAIVRKLQSLVDKTATYVKFSIRKQVYTACLVENVSYEIEQTNVNTKVSRGIRIPALHTLDTAQAMQKAEVNDEEEVSSCWIVDAVQAMQEAGVKFEVVGDRWIVDPDLHQSTEMMRKADCLRSKATRLTKKADLLYAKAQSIATQVHQSRKRKHEKANREQVLEMKIQHLQQCKMKIK